MKKYAYLDIGNGLKKLRKSLSQKEFAEKIDVPFRTYQRYESGERLPPEPVLKRIAEICNTTVDVIQGNDPFASLKRMFDEERQKIATEKAETAAYLETVREKLSSKMGIPIPENISAFLEVLAFYSKQKINIVSLIKGHTYTRKEQELIDMLVGILRGENEDNSKAIIENVKAFYKTRNINIPDESNKKTPEDTEESGGHGMVGDHPRLDQSPKLEGNSYLEDVG